MATAATAKADTAAKGSHAIPVSKDSHTNKGGDELRGNFDGSELRFAPVTAEALPAINALLQRADSRTCDYTVGGIYMWIDYFAYEYCIYRDTLFIKGVREDDRRSPAFSLPIGAMPVEQAVRLVAAYCDASGIPLCFSAIPEDKIDYFMITDVAGITELTDWSDYLYDAASMATYAGKKMSKKRNHFNRFVADNPGYRFEPLTADVIDEVIGAYREMLAVDAPDTPTGLQEQRQTLGVLRHWERYPFSGGVLRDGAGRIAAFTVGEVIGDTLFVHIEKMRHDIAGAGETIARLYAADVAAHHPIAFVNREEDCGDPGLRASKQSYHPVAMLRKYNIIY